MTDLTPEQTMEARILKAVRSTLIDVIKDTTTEPGLKHPLSERTIENIRQCLALITTREGELAEAAGVSRDARPRFIDEPSDRVVVSLDTAGKSKPTKKKE